MKKLVFILIVMFGMIGTITCQTVYVTKTGKKYHSDGCSYLKSSQIEMSLSDAKNKGYTPCSKCGPPTSVEKKTETVKEKPAVKEQPVVKEKNTQPAKKSTATQCTGTTKAGKQCSRMTTDPSGRCYQHK